MKAWIYCRSFIDGTRDACTIKVYSSLQKAIDANPGDWKKDKYVDTEYENTAPEDPYDRKWENIYEYEIDSDIEVWGV